MLNLPPEFDELPVSDFVKPPQWEFIDNSSQELALKANVNVLLLTGGRGWGKTELQLMRFRSLVGLGYGTYWRGIIFDREYKNLDDLIVKSKRLFYGGQGPAATFLSSTSALGWKWETGEELLFRQAKKEDDYWAYHGHEYAFVGWNELTKYPTIKLFHKMFSINRTGFDPEKHTPRLTGEIVGNMADFERWEVTEDIKHRKLNNHYLGRPFQVGDYATNDGRPLPPIPLETVATTNPYGPGHNWVKAEFIDVAPFGTITTKERVIMNPKTKKEEIVKRTQLTIHGSFKENPYLSPQYIAGLMEQTDENIIKAWINGDWDIVAGGAFDDVWKKGVHILPRFRVPHSWRIDRSFDWGSSHPFSVGWWAEADGTEAIFYDPALKRDRVFCPPKGTLIQIAELYGSTKVGANQGVKWSATKVAEAIIEVEKRLMADGWITKQPLPGPADNQISNVNEVDTDTLEKKMAAKGVRWEKSDKSSGSRAIGLELMRERLDAAMHHENPALYFMDNCRASVSTIPVLPRDPDNLDDVDTSAEDHPYDMTRYRCLKAGQHLAQIIHVNFG